MFFLRIKDSVIRAALKHLHLKLKLVMKTIMKHIQRPACSCSKLVSVFPKHCWHCRHSFQAVLAYSRATNSSQPQSADWKCVCVCVCLSVFPTFIISAISTRLIFTLTSSLFICWCLSIAGVWLYIVLNKHVALNKRMHTVGIWNALPSLSESVTCESGGARRGLLSAQEICWCWCLPKCVQYASLNHEVTI